MGGFGRDPIPGFAPTAIPSTTPLRIDTACLKVLNGPGAGREFPLDRLRLWVGRSDPPGIAVDIDLTECELGVPPKVSRRHAEILWVEGTLQVTDLGSSNGTWVDGKRLPVSANAPLSEPAYLPLGSKIRFANLECEVTVFSLD